MSNLSKENDSMIVENFVIDKGPIKTVMPKSDSYRLLEKAASQRYESRNVLHDLKPQNDSVEIKYAELVHEDANMNKVPVVGIDVSEFNNSEELREPGPIYIKSELKVKQFKAKGLMVLGYRGTSVGREGIISTCIDILCILRVLL